MNQIKDLIQNGPNGNHMRWFENLAQCLLSNYVIAVGHNKYRILEMEFYYYSQDHMDKSTYGYKKPGVNIKSHIKKLKSAQYDSLTWFFHYSGIDLTIGNKENPGGILIRQIQNIESRDVFPGPIITMLELINQNASAENASINLRLIRQDPGFKIEMVRRKRKGIGENAGEFKDRHYNFSTGSNLKIEVNM